MIKHVCIVFMLAVMCTGCASTRLYVNGAPAAENVSMISNPETGIQAIYTVTIHTPRKEGKEMVDQYHHIPFNCSIHLSKDTTAILVTLRLVNENKVSYSLWEKYDLTYIEEGRPYKVEHELYSGSLSTNEFQLRCPIKVEKGDYSLEIRTKEGKLLFNLGKLSYEYVGKEVTSRQ
jgi:hypothetical protein